MDRIMRIGPEHECLQYCGRIDFEDEKAPEFVYPCSSVALRVSGSRLGVTVGNRQAYWDNYLGYIIDGVQGVAPLPGTGETVTLSLAEGMEDVMHDVLLFKRQDSCHTFRFYGFEAEEGAAVESPSPLPARKIEVYGDSVSAGEVAEAVEFVGKEDPPHNGEHSNSYYSYAWITARNLKAQIHDIAQGGIALLHGTGWFMEPDSIGMEEIYDKIQYQPCLGPQKQWDFRRYRPHVVLVAIGQNDSHPEDYMAEDYDGVKAVKWREHYKAFIRRLRQLYPKAAIVLATTILRHDASWDRAIHETAEELGREDGCLYHFLYSENGKGTPGHIRIPEAEKMAAELTAFLEGLGESIWAEEG